MLNDRTDYQNNSWLGIKKWVDIEYRGSCLKKYKQCKLFFVVHGCKPVLEVYAWEPIYRKKNDGHSESFTNNFVIFLSDFLGTHALHVLKALYFVFKMIPYTIQNISLYFIRPRSYHWANSNCKIYPVLGIQIKYRWNTKSFFNGLSIVVYNSLAKLRRVATAIHSFVAKQYSVLWRYWKSTSKLFLKDCSGFIFY